jgi:hypothetical protein
MDGDRVALYREEIVRRSPPASRHDELMIEVYSRLLESAMELKRMERVRIDLRAAT